MEAQTQAQKKLNFRELKVGDFISETQYYEVLRVSNLGAFVKNERGLEFGIDKEILEEGAYSEDQYHTESVITKTKMAEVFQTLGDSVFKVTYRLLPKDSDISDAINDINKGKILSNAKITEIVRDAMKGRTKTLVGYRVSGDAGLGRSLVWDLKDKGFKQVDHRTIESLICKNIRYIVK